MVYTDHNGQVHYDTSASFAGCEGTIFTPDVTNRFMELTSQGGQVGSQFSSESPLYTSTPRNIPLTQSTPQRPFHSRESPFLECTVLILGPSGPETSRHDSMRNDNKPKSKKGETNRRHNQVSTKVYISSTNYATTRTGRSPRWKPGATTTVLREGL